MTKYKVVVLWNAVFKNKEEAYDYTGRLMKKSACGNPHSRFHPTIDHIRPLSDGGQDTLDNIVICHSTTNEEKANSFPCWVANGEKFHAVRVKGTRGKYQIVNG